MNLKASLIVLTVVSVVCDTMLLPFYPQFFAQEFSINAPEHTGYYIAACCITVMLFFPVWAQVAKKIQELHLWVYTQIAAGLLGVASYFASSIIEFWVCSLLMLVFKASYLLIYPFVMRLEEKDKHLNLVGLFAVLMHFGAIGGALLGGTVLQWLQPRSVYLIMPFGDAIQVVVCLYLIVKLSVHWRKAPLNPDNKSLIDQSHNVTPEPSFVKSHVFYLGVVSLIVYFAAFSIRPFLSIYWESITEIESRIVSGFVYSIPGWVALCGLWLNFKYSPKLSLYQKVALSFVWLIIGSLIQSSNNDWLFVIGRIVYGWGLFQVTVCLEVLLFQESGPEHYSRDFSRIHIFQNIGIIGASYGTGYLVSILNAQWPFFLSAVVFVIALLCFFAVYWEKITFKPTLLNTAIQKS